MMAVGKVSPHRDDQERTDHRQEDERDLLPFVRLSCVARTMASNGIAWALPYS